mmetsp:Transcript_23515/g.48721  ORF Transcript_23515/g.48721 Transcript_23515/m.48721 type:complete len:395 (+) Transcript_23515:133-1317(+)|eukprot:CAMPEP_0178545788 /NCGR_PEP_ID=MMETSP0697-20121206/3821_1 /TAXON_ID=265572 /ORGANISM="Extubocellulus spinifer, Strain CCMP396" /LENGTH=394 /DNA_ID=CAMNT_0020178363 /DNA_START=12 /DNA_END=1196 /DNA_ORIENTATION=-
MSITWARLASRCRISSTTGTRDISRRSITSSALTIERTTSDEKFNSKPPNDELKFGVTLSDHQLSIEWHSDTAWSTPQIKPTEDLRLSPAASSLHYGLQCFEGMKAYKSPVDGSLRLFRPDLNMARLQRSMERLQMHGYSFDPEELLECIKELIRVDERWVPDQEGYSLYIRPTVIATHPFLGLAAPESMLLYCITSPVGPYYTSGFAPVRLTADTDFVRAWPGGTGDVKIGGNYAPTMKAGAMANEQGYNQVLWTFGDQDEATEVGAMNFFVLLDSKTPGDRPELVTAPLDGTILPGVTRQSILDLARSWDEFDVVERFPTMGEIRDAAREGRLIEAFGAGTAAIVSPISCIQYQGKDIDISTTGDLTQRFFDELIAIQYGKKEGPDGWSIKI